MGGRGVTVVFGFFQGFARESLLQHVHVALHVLEFAVALVDFERARLGFVTAASICGVACMKSEMREKKKLTFDIEKGSRLVTSKKK